MLVVLSGLTGGTGQRRMKGSHGVCWVWVRLFSFFLALFLALSKIRSSKEGENPGLSFRGCVKPGMILLCHRLLARPWSGRLILMGFTTSSGQGFV